MILALLIHNTEEITLFTVYSFFDYKWNSTTSPNPY